MRRLAAMCVILSLGLFLGCGDEKTKTPDKTTVKEKTTETSDGKTTVKEKTTDSDAEQAIAIIKQLGGKIEQDPNLAGMPVTAVDLRGTKLSDQGLTSLRGLKNLKVLQLGGNQITDAGLAELTKLPALEELVVNSGGGAITDAGLAPFAGLKSLKKLVFGAYSQVSGAGLEGLTHLEHLDIAYSTADDRALERIGRLVNLRYLRLDHNNTITDAGLVHLKGLTQLETLGLYNLPQISDKGLETLHGLKTLKVVLLQQTKVSDQGVQRFQAAVPDCKIQR